MKIAAPSRSRVEARTSRRSRERIERETRKSVNTHGRAGRAAIERRLRELDAEWDIERAIEANAASLALGGTLLGLFAHRAFLALPIAVTAFLLQHAVQGWCPPVPLLRRLGFRTPWEIGEERAALKALRGDFRRVENARNPAQALRAARR